MAQVARQIAAHSRPAETAEQSEHAVGVLITKITDALPSAEDIARVETHLTLHHDWPGVPPTSA